jgi:hypothetical protein
MLINEEDMIDEKMRSAYIQNLGWQNKIKRMCEIPTKNNKDGRNKYVLSQKKIFPLWKEKFTRKIVISAKRKIYETMG